MKKIFLLGLSFFGFAFSANADENFEYTPYVGIDYGYMQAKTQNQKPNYHLLNVNVGTKYNQHFGTEAFFEQSSSDAKKIDSESKIKSSYRAYGLDVSAYLPLGCYHDFDLTATVGAGEYVFYDKLNHQKHNRESGFGYRIGIGMMYNINENVSLRALMRYVDLNDISKVNHLYEYSLGLRYHFY
ncbi:MAG: porin family protein [Alphaproteobacteria bacterium]|nr:porin family protein [Alphaproteobacteria bacterium]